MVYFLLILVTLSYQMNHSGFEAFFTTQQLHRLSKQMYKSDRKINNEVPPQTTEINFKTHTEKERYDCLAGVELKNDIIYAFARNNQSDCQVVLYSFRKANGQKHSFSFKGFNGSISCMAFILAYSKNQEEQKTAYNLVIGFRDGFLKVINIANKSRVDGLRMDVKAIISILAGDYQRFCGHNVCIVLGQDYSIYIVDTDKLKIAFVLRPSLIMCDKALSIEINLEYSYLMQATQGGYIVFWKMADILLHFKERDRESRLRQYKVLPVRITHSLAIEGLIWCSFYGHLIAIITKKGVLKIFAFNVRNSKPEDEFIILLQHQISHPESIKCVQMSSQQDAIFIASSKTKHCKIIKLIIDDLLTISHILVFRLGNLENIQEFFLPRGSSILMCRSLQQYSIGYSEELSRGDQENQIQGGKMY